MRILRDIVVIVVVNEIVVADAAIGNDGYHSKDDANSGYLPGLIGCEDLATDFAVGASGEVLDGDLRWRDFFGMVCDLRLSDC